MRAVGMPYLLHVATCSTVALSRIAAANVEIEGTDVCAYTLHALFDLDGEFQSRLDLSKLDSEKTKQLMTLDVLLLDSCW